MCSSYQGPGAAEVHELDHGMDEVAHIGEATQGDESRPAEDGLGYALENTEREKNH